MKKIVTMMVSLCLFLLTACAGGEESLEARSYAAEAAEVDSVAIDVSGKEIQVSPSEDGQIRIDYCEGGKTAYDIQLTDGVLTMTEDGGAGLGQYFGVRPSGDGAKIHLQIPSGVLASLELTTSDEDISLAAMTAADRVVLVNNNGDIAFDALDVGSGLTVENKNGDITGTIAGGYEDYAITSSVKKGENSLPGRKEGGEKSLDVTNNNGDIDVTFTAG